MPSPDDLIEKRRFNCVAAGLTRTGMYHSFRLPDGRLLEGAMTLEWQLERLATFGLPDDLSGKRVLDIGPWDGFYTFEMERRGAQVTAVDYVDLDTFRYMHRLFESKADYRRMDVYELDPNEIGTFDIVLCFGVLYHFKHPLLALEKICAVTRGACLIDTFVVDGVAWQQGIRPPLPYVEFYERGELGGQLDNWCGPTVGAVEALARAAGFARTSVARVTDGSAGVAAHRRWDELPADVGPPVEIVRLNCHSDRGRSFRSNKEEYVQLWCRFDAETAPASEVVFVEIDGLGALALDCSQTADGLVIQCRVPPGLSPGRHEVRIKIENAVWSKPSEFHLDLPAISNQIELLSIQDGVSWDIGQVDWAHGGWLTVWVDGLSAEADAGNTLVEISGIPHTPDQVFAAKQQVNLRLRPILQAGRHPVVVRHRGAATAPKDLRVLGNPPPIRGLEALRS